MSEQLYTTEKGYVLKELYIISSNGKAVSIFNMMLELGIFEDIYNSSVSGYVLLNDSNDLFAITPLSGFEFIGVVLEKPGSQKNIVLEKMFRVYKMGAPDSNPSTTSNQSYVLHFCSEENLVSSSRRISKAYRGKTVSNIIKDILVNHLSVSPSKVRAENIEETSGVHDIVIPFLNPLAAIAWLTSRTVSATSKSSGANFMFYENTEGFNFKSLETLFQKPTKAKYTYSSKNREPSKNDTSLTEIREVIKYEFMNVFDTMSGINSGMFSSTLKTIDLLKLQASDYTMNYKDFFENTSHIEKGKKAFGFQNEYQDRFKNTTQENYYSVMRMYPTNKGHDTDSIISAKQPSIKQNFVEKWMLQRITQINQLNFVKVKLVIPGDTFITVGDIIEFQMPLVSTKDPGSTNYNPYHSGRYLITAIRHKINRDNYEMIVEGTRDSISAPYSSAKNDEPIISGIKKI